MTFSIYGGNRRRWLGALLVLSLGVAAAVTYANPIGPSRDDRRVAITVTAMLPKEHLSRRPLDGEISKRTLHLFLKTLDPMKMYFYQTDVDVLTQRQFELVKKASDGDVGLAYAIFSIFLQRMDERVKMVDELLTVDPDFTVKEDMVIDHDAAQYAKTPAEAREKWRKRIKFELLTLKADKVDGAEAKQKLAQRYHGLAKRTHQTDAGELLEMFLSSITGSYDPHTSYMSPDSVKDFEILMSLDLEGIGAALQFTDGYTVVHNLVPGGAAEKNGRLKVEDKIIGVGQGENGEIVDVVDMKLRDVVKLIRGKRGTVVRLQVMTGKAGERKIYNITREKIELKDSEANSKIFEQGRRPDGRPYKIGIINLPSFYMDMNGAREGRSDFRSTTRDVRRILDDFNTRGVDAVILDLRRNGGGSLTEAINLTGLFVGRGPVVQVKGADGRAIPYPNLDPVAWTGPLVVLTSKFSASASEILAGAIQDYHRGLIVGDHTTHGKGTVQSLLNLGEQLLFNIPNLPGYGSLKITVQQFYRPNGDSTQQRGVVADVELPSVTTHLDVGEADLDYSLPFDRVDPVSFQAFRLVDKNLVAELASRSAQRCASSADFKKVQRNIALYLERKHEKKVTLNETEFMKERDEFDPEKEEEKGNAPEEPIKRDFYLDEAMALTQDYLGLLLNRTTATLAGPQASAAHAVVVPQ